MASEHSKQINQPQKEISLTEIIKEVNLISRYLLTKWVFILLAGLLGGAIGFAYAYFKKPIYTATTTFVLEDDKGGSGGLGSIAGIASMAGLDLGTSGGGIFQGDNILELYRSRKMIRKTLLTPVSYKGKNILLIDRYLEFNEKREQWAKNPELKDISFAAKPNGEYQFNRLQDSVLSSIINDIDKSYLKVSRPDKKLSIIKADVVATDEFFAKLFNEKIVENVNDFYVQTKTKKSAENVAILQQKTDSVRRVMNGEIYKSVVVADATPNLNPTRQVQRAVPIQRSQFSAETNRAMLGELVKNLELSKISLRNEKPLLEVVDVPIFPLYKDKFGKAKGLILGGIVAGILSIVFLLIKRFLKSTIA